MNKLTRSNFTKKQYFGFYKPSLMFSILAGIVVVIFGVAMINLMALPSFEEKRDQQNKQAFERQLKADAERAGVPFDQFKRQYEIQQTKTQEQNKRNSLIYKTKSEIDQAIKNQDDLAFDQAIVKVTIEEIEQFITKIYSLAIKHNHSYAFNRLNAMHVPCDFQSNTGNHAFISAVNSKNSEYLKTLIENGCATGSGKNSKKLVDLILQSKHKHYVLLVQDAEVKPSVLNDLLLNAVQDSSSKMVLNLIKLGADPNGIKPYQSALYLSLTKGKTENAMVLIRNGAKINSTDISEAVVGGHIDVVRAMLKSDTEYQKSDDHMNRMLQSIFIKKDIQNRKELIELLIENGLKLDKLEGTGVQFLIKAVEYQDVGVVELLLKQGVSPRKRFKFQTALGSAKILDGKTRDKIITLLMQYEATDDVLELVREENNISSNSKCEMGDKINYDYRNLVKKLAQKRENDTKEINEHGVVCLAAGFDCVNQGFGLDDCMHSIPACVENDSSNQELCCEDVFKNKYFNARCAGLSVKEALNWLDLNE